MGMYENQYKAKERKLCGFLYKVSGYILRFLFR